MSSTTPQSTPQPLESIFPKELFSLIISKAERSQLPSINRVSHHFHKTSSPLLYRAVFIDVTSAVTRSCIAPAGKAPIIQCLAPSTILGLEGGVYLAWCDIPLDEGLFQLDPLPHSFTYLTRLSLHAHMDVENECRGLRSLSLPHLQTLQVIPYPHDAPPKIPQKLDICNPSFICHSYDHTYTSHPSLCGLLSGLRPRRLILGGADTTLTGTGAGLWTERGTFPPRWLEEITIYIGLYPLQPGKSFLAEIPKTIKRLTLVFQPLLGESHWQPAIDQGLGDVEDYEEGLEPFYLWTRLGEISAGEAEMMEIVGLETVLTNWTGGATVKEMEDMIREETFKMGQKAGQSKRTAYQKAMRIEFIHREALDQREREQVVKMNGA